MTNRRNLIWLLTLVLAVSIFAGFFVYPKGYGLTIRPWRLGLDLVGGSHLTYEVDLKDVGSNDRENVVNGLRDVIEKRVNLFGVAEPQVLVAKSGDSYRLLVELAGIKDISGAIKEIGETPFLSFAEVEYDKTKTGEAANLPSNFLPTKLTGRFVSGAQLNFDTITGAPQVSINFNEEGAKIFEELTAKNIGKPVAIFLDKQLIEMPIVQEKISGGRAQITGRFTAQAARQLVERFNAGALPAPINLVSQETIGASLGADSLKKTLWAGLIGTIAIMLFMIIYYGGLGLGASLALMIYVVLTMAIFKLFGVTMTLAGIAGFMLSIGMAVDANVLIFERHKEERRKGASKISALSEGFSRAWPSIRDSNISTMLTAVILYYATSGFVRGFALTLLIGVLMSMFSAITVTRSIVGAFIKGEPH